MGGEHRGVTRRCQSSGDKESYKYRMWLGIQSKQFQSLMELICTFKTFPLISLWAFYRGIFIAFYCALGSSSHPIISMGIWHLSSTLADSFFVRKFPVQMDYSHQGLLLVCGRYKPTYIFSLRNVGHSDSSTEDKYDMQKLP